MPDFTPAVETLLRTVASAGDKGARFDVAPRCRYRLTGTDYVVNQRSFYPLTSRGYATDGGDDSAPVKLTARGREWMKQNPVPRGSRGPHSCRPGPRPQPAPQPRATARQLSAYAVMKGQFEESGMHSFRSPVYARAVLAMRDLETADKLERTGFPEAAEHLRIGLQALVDAAFGPEVQ
jgi:hypothetical protein